MLLRLKTSELGGGGRNPLPQVQQVFKIPGTVGLTQISNTYVVFENQAKIDKSYKS